MCICGSVPLKRNSQLRSKKGTLMKIIDMIDSPNFDPQTNAGRGDWSLRDVTSEQVFLDDYWHKPVCIEHGAMNAVNPERTIWRCLACSRSCYAIRDE